MVDFNFRTLNIESLAQKNKEDAMNALERLNKPRTSKTKKYSKDINLD